MPSIDFEQELVSVLLLWFYSQFKPFPCLQYLLIHLYFALRPCAIFSNICMLLSTAVIGMSEGHSWCHGAYTLADEISEWHCQQNLIEAARVITSVRKECLFLTRDLPCWEGSRTTVMLVFVGRQKPSNSGSPLFQGFCSASVDCSSQDYHKALSAVGCGEAVQFLFNKCT